MEQLIEKIKKGIYWERFTDGQVKAITEILDHPQATAMSRANAICEYLDIEKRGNRSTINQIILDHEINDQIKNPT